MGQQNPQKPNQNKTKKYDIILVIIIIIVVASIYLFARSAINKPDELTVASFWEYLEAGQIRQGVTYESMGGDDIGHYLVEGKYVTTSGEKNFKVYIPQNLFIEYILDPGAKYNTLNPTLKPASPIPWVNIILLVVVPIVLVVMLVLYMMKNATGGNNKAFEFGKTRAKLSRGSKKTFNDVAGCDEEKQEMEEIIDFLRNPKKYYEIGARIPKGILLVGPPGTGKTLLAKAVAGEAKVPFYTISGSDFVEMFVGVGASRVRDMFKTAKQTAPCIVFIDEIDAVGRQRGAGLGGGHDEREQTLNQLLVEMDGFGENSGVIILAATNRVDVLDPALLRPGRFDRHITISNPDVKGRTEILQVHSRNKKISPKVNLEDIAKRTPGFSGADLENLLNEAALLAAREDRKEIKIYDIDEAVDRVMMGPAKRSRKYSVKEKQLVAYHEAGHAVIGVKLESANIVQKVTIVPRGEVGGYNLMAPEEERFFTTRTDLIETITGLLGGRVAEELKIGEISTGAHNDIQRATRIARAMVTEYGMSELGPIQYEKNNGSVFLGRDYMLDKNFSDQVALEIDHAVRNVINECHKKASEVIKSNMELLENIAYHLMEIETLTKEDITEIVETGKLEWWEKKKAKAEADKKVKEKEAELAEIYKKQLEQLNQDKKDTPKEED